MNIVNTLVRTLDTPNLRLKYYTRLYAEIYFQTGNQSNIMRYPMVMNILTQYNISK